MKNVKDAPIIEFMSPEGIVMYPWIFEKNPEPDDSGKTWYGCVLKFPKDTVNADELKGMRRQFMKAARQGYPDGNDGGGGFTVDFGSPMRDGDKFDKANNKKRNEELFGHWYVSFKTKNQPGCVTVALGGESIITDGRPRQAVAGELIDVTTKDDFYPGCTAVVSGVAFPYENKGNEGVGVRMTNVFKSGEGYRIGGKPSAKTQFAHLTKGAPGRNDTDADELL